MGSEDLRAWSSGPGSVSGKGAGLEAGALEAAAGGTLRSWSELLGARGCDLRPKGLRQATAPGAPGGSRGHAETRRQSPPCKTPCPH